MVRLYLYRAPVLSLFLIFNCRHCYRYFNIFSMTFLCYVHMENKTILIVFLAYVSIENNQNIF